MMSSLFLMAAIAFGQEPANQNWTSYQEGNKLTDEQQMSISTESLDKEARLSIACINDKLEIGIYAENIWFEPRIEFGIAKMYTGPSTGVLNGQYRFDKNPPNIYWGYIEKPISHAFIFDPSHFSYKKLVDLLVENQSSQFIIGIPEYNSGTHVFEFNLSGISAMVNTLQCVK